jgi:HAD superfamily hydrolase (TIGR01484 family)
VSELQRANDSIHELAALGQRLRGIFTDVDDTLTHKGVVVPSAYDALCRAADAGLPVVVVTGRPAGYAEVLALTWPLAGAIAENGAFAVRRRGKSVERMLWDGDAVGDEQRRKLDIMAQKILAEVPGARLANDQWLRRRDVAFDIGETQTLSQPTIDAIVTRIQQAGARALISSVHAHAFFGDHDKARMCERFALQFLDEDLPHTRADWLFVGDSPNDQSCFAYFPNAAGVANVRRYTDLLAPSPRFIADGEGGHGFAEIVSVLLAART